MSMKGPITDLFHSIFRAKINFLSEFVFKSQVFKKIFEL